MNYQTLLLNGAISDLENGLQNSESPRDLAQKLSGVLEDFVKIYPTLLLKLEDSEIRGVLRYSLEVLRSKKKLFDK